MFCRLLGFGVGPGSSEVGIALMLKCLWLVGNRLLNSPPLKCVPWALWGRVGPAGQDGTHIEVPTAGKKQAPPFSSLFLN